MIIRILASRVVPILVGLGSSLGPVGEAREDAGAPAAELVAEADEPELASPEQVVDTVLPCGLRVIAAKDASLPVAAVVLAIEVGTRDDPEKLPGLVHALAYHLQQGNRELAPGEAIATAHDVGGLAAMAVGPAQVRFESLVPASQLDAQLRVESLRLRAPNTGRELWLKSLSYARGDDKPKLVVAREVAALAWDDPGLEHDGRLVTQALGDMIEQSLGAQLARLFDYRHATLVVVGPDDPQALLRRVEPLFVDLPARPRKALAEATPPRPKGNAPRVLRLPRQAGDSMVWAVPGTPAGRAWAQVLCGALNRQPRAADEPAKARLRCTFADDPRRPLLVVRAIGHEPTLGPEPLIAGRLARLAAAAGGPDGTEAEADDELAALIEEQRARTLGDLAYALRTPLDLASYLASAAQQRDRASAELPLRSRDSILGLPIADDPSTISAMVAAIPSLFDTRAAVLLLDPDHDVPPPVHGEDPQPAVGPEDPQPAVGPEDPQPAVGPEDPQPAVGPEDPQSGKGAA
jgi:hypothetical protein